MPAHIVIFLFATLLASMVFGTLVLTLGPKMRSRGWLLAAHNSILLGMAALFLADTVNAIFRTYTLPPDLMDQPQWQLDFGLFRFAKVLFPLSLTLLFAWRSKDWGSSDDCSPHESPSDSSSSQP